MATPQTVFGRRRAGMLAHITSLPGPGAQGTLGAEAYRFVDFLARASFSVWQTLPVGPVNVSASPYQSSSAFAGNTALLPDDGGLAYGSRYTEFREAQGYWLEDYVLYRALQRRHASEPWYRWPVSLRDREPDAIEAARVALDADMEAERRAQYAFFEAWRRLKSHANASGVYLFGDLPMFAAHDSVDVWRHRELFCIDAVGGMTETAGAPPDAYAEQGQDWGCPQYRWDTAAGEGFRWWIERLRMQTSQFDILRLDHFRGFDAGWRIPAGAPSAAAGRWEPVPGEALFDALHEALGPLSLVAEDLGHITPEVQDLRRRLGLPGMHVLQFAFGSDDANPHLPHNHEHQGVVYTGTHDNDTSLGWWRGLDAGTRERVLRYLDYPAEAMPWPFVHSALASVCALAVLPLQDCLALGSEARMNTPGTREGNWRWRCPQDALDDALAEELGELVQLYGRDG